MDTEDAWRVLENEHGTARSNIVADIVGHPNGAISLEELAHMNPSLDTSDIRDHLRLLEDEGVIEQRHLALGDRRDGFPHRFFSLSTKAREEFDKSELFPENAWRREYAAVAKPAQIKEIESIPRPDA